MSRVCPFYCFNNRNKGIQTIALIANREKEETGKNRKQTERNHVQNQRNNTQQKRKKRYRKPIEEKGLPGRRKSLFVGWKRWLNRRRDLKNLFLLLLFLSFQTIPILFRREREQTANAFQEGEFAW